MNVDDVVAAKIEAARRRAEEAKRRRAALSAARQRGLAHRHAAKVAKNPAGGGQRPGPAGDAWAAAKPTSQASSHSEAPF